MKTFLHALFAIVFVIDTVLFINLIQTAIRMRETAELWGKSVPIIAVEWVKGERKGCFFDFNITHSFSMIGIIGIITLLYYAFVLVGLKSGKIAWKDVPFSSTFPYR